MFDNACDGFANAPGGVLMLVSVDSGVVYHNVIARSVGYAAFQGLESSPHSYAPHNYWGDSTGPMHQDENPEGLGDSVEYLVHVAPWGIDSTFDEQNSVVTSPVPLTYALGYPFPNPFNASVTIEYALTREQQVLLEVFDVLGKHVATLVSESQSIGVHQVSWNAEAEPSGIYFALLSSPGSGQTMQSVKLTLLK
jgi:hypothetical protein